MVYSEFATKPQTPHPRLDPQVRGVGKGRNRQTTIMQYGRNCRFIFCDSRWNYPNMGFHGYIGPDFQR